MIIFNTDYENYNRVQGWDILHDPPSFIERPKIRLINGFVRTAPEEILARIPRILLSKAEVAERIRHQYEIDEARGFKVLAQKGSVSCALFLEWRLSRAIIKNAPQNLSYNRRLQVTLASILTSTHFRFYDTLAGGTNACLLAICRKCGERETPAHLLQHADISQMTAGPEELVSLLAQLAIESDVINPHISVPLLLTIEEEVELEMETASSSVSLESLSFEA